VKLPNGFKVAWWILLLVVIGAYLLRRYPEVVAGRSAPIDAVVFLVWVALCLMPFFQEMSFLGFQFKQAMDDLKKEVAAQVSSLKADVRNSTDLRSQINPQFYLQSPPPPDSLLPAIEEHIRKVVADLQPPAAPQSPTPTGIEPATDDVNGMFWARYQIERELRRLGGEGDYVGPPTSNIPRLLQGLVASQAVAPELADAIREVYRVSSPAIHGQPFTRGQRDFVRATAPQLIAALRNIRTNPA